MNTRLNKTQKYAIQWLMSEGKDSAEIVSELKLPSKPVNNFIAKNNKATSDSSIKTTSGPITSKDLMIRHTNTKQTNNVAVMTKEASEVADDFKKNITKQEQRHSNNIHNIS